VPGLGGLVAVVHRGRGGLAALGAVREPPLGGRLAQGWLFGVVRRDWERGDVERP
jgi:hypothetical protein